MRMKLIAAGAAVAMAAPFAATAADTEWYGRLHLSVDHFTDADAGDTDDGTYFASNSSRFGFKGSEELDNGLTALGQIEASVPGGQNFNNMRDTYVGLGGGFGKVLVGRLPGANQYVYDVNFFADQVGDAGGY